MFLHESDPRAAAETIPLILDGLKVLASYPLIGRPIDVNRRELVIFRGRTGYLAQYGFRLAADTQHRVGVYFIGVGESADLEVGRMLAEATGSSFLGTTVDDLAPVVQLFSVYF